jgi:hypothetical protein
MADVDLAWALGIAIVIVILALCVWPGFARVKLADVEGNWASQAGDLYQIRPAAHGTRAFVILGGGATADGELRGLRGLHTAGDEGRVGLGGSLVWRKMGAWYRQGIKPRATHATRG